MCHSSFRNKENKRQDGWESLGNSSPYLTKHFLWPDAGDVESHPNSSSDNQGLNQSGLKDMSQKVMSINVLENFSSQEF